MDGKAISISFFNKFTFDVAFKKCVCEHNRPTLKTHALNPLLYQLSIIWSHGNNIIVLAFIELRLMHANKHHSVTENLFRIFIQMCSFSHSTYTQTEYIFHSCTNNRKRERGKENGWNPNFLQHFTIIIKNLLILCVSVRCVCVQRAKTITHRNKWDSSIFRFSSNLESINRSFNSQHERSIRNSPNTYKIYSHSGTEAEENAFFFGPLKSALLAILLYFPSPSSHKFACTFRKYLFAQAIPTKWCQIEN